MKTATEIGLILGCSSWKIGLIAHRQKWVLRQIKSVRKHGKIVMKYMVTDEELEAYKIDNEPMPPYRMIDSDVNRIEQKSWYIHFGIMDIPKHWDSINETASKIRIDVTSHNNVIYKNDLKRVFQMKSEDKIKMMNKIKYLMIHRSITKTVDIWKSMNESGDIPEVRTGGTMASNTFYMYARQARREVYND